MTTPISPDVLSADVRAALAALGRFGGSGGGPLHYEDGDVRDRALPTCKALHFLGRIS